jgi:hypothetical protein
MLTRLLHLLLVALEAIHMVLQVLNLLTSLIVSFLIGSLLLHYVSIVL